MIKSYKIEEEGYHPFFIREGWQIAFLNFSEQQHINNIETLEIHRKTDEVFILLKGRVFLIAALIENEQPIFETVIMKLNKVYDIPRNTWHNIAMEKGSEVLIVEKSNTHLNDTQYRPMNSKKKKELILELKNCNI